MKKQITNVKALVLNSGGIDSTTCLAKAIADYGKENVATVSIYYGQKHNKELECAYNIAIHYDVPHYTLNLSEIFKFDTHCSLLQQNNKEIDKSDYKTQVNNTKGNIETYVPFRNGLFISAVASLALELNPNNLTYIYLGNHSEDYGKFKKAIYPDCSPQFSNSIKKTLELGSGGLVSLICPFKNKTKTDIVKYGLEHKVPYHLTWSCYEGKDKPCGKCGTCLDAIKAFKDNGADYLSLYKGKK